MHAGLTATLPEMTYYVSSGTLNSTNSTQLQVKRVGRFPPDPHSPYIFFNTIPPCPSQKGEGMAEKEEEQKRESTNSMSGNFLWHCCC